MLKEFKKNLLRLTLPVGFSVLEVVMALFIVTIGVLGVASLALQNLQVQYINKNVLIAAQLAQEGLELVKNVRDQNWLILGNSWDQDLVNDGTYAIDYQGRSSINSVVNLISEAGARLYLDSNGFYTHTVTATSTNFSRLITVAQQANYLDINCTVRLAERGQSHDYVAKIYLYDWR